MVSVVHQKLCALGKAMPPWLAFAVATRQHCWRLLNSLLNSLLRGTSRCGGQLWRAACLWKQHAVMGVLGESTTSSTTGVALVRDSRAGT